jgi:hypothetical protein
LRFIAALCLAGSVQPQLPATPGNMGDNEVRTLAISSAGRFCNYSGIIDMGVSG